MATVASAVVMAMMVHPVRQFSVVVANNRPAATSPTPVPELTVVWAPSLLASPMMREISPTVPGVAKPAPAPATTTPIPKTTVLGAAATVSAPAEAEAPAQTTRRRGHVAPRAAITAATQ